MVFAVGQTAYTFYVDVAESSIDIGEATYGLSVKLSPSVAATVRAIPPDGSRTALERRLRALTGRATAGRVTRCC